VSKDRAGRYFVSLLCDDAVAAKPVAAGKVGIDLGLTHFAILSSGEKIKTPKHFRTNEQKLATLSRRLAKKQKGSNGRAKARWYGRELIGIDRWYPSSKRCSKPSCGFVAKAMPLAVREWTCPQCGTRHDRDINAEIRGGAAVPLD